MICGSGLDRERNRTGTGSHIVHFILDAVEQLPITDFRVNDRGTGIVQYNLKRLFTLKNLAAAA
jgi:hypothetical protein